jgi:LEA14-like dessication related protein
LLPGCSPLLRLIGKPKVVGVRPRVTSIGFAGVTLDAQTDLRNPYPLRLRAVLLRYGLDIEGSEFLKSETPVDVAIPARTVGTVVVPVRLSYAKVWATYRRLRDLPEASYRFHGVVLASFLGVSFEIPFAHEDKFPILHAPRFSHVRLRFSEVSLRSAMLTVEAEVANPNAFPIDIRGLGFVVEAGDDEFGGLSASTAEQIPAGGTGRITLAGHISAASVLMRVIRGETLRKARLCPSGSILTPYGPVKLERVH